MDRTRLLERVAKLYRMSRETESSPHEAEIALRRCQSLMDRFGIREADLERSEFGAATIGRRFRAVPSYVRVLGSAVARLHDCLCAVGDTVEFRGYRVDAEVAGLTYAYLSASMERSLSARRRAGAMAPGRAASFDYRVGYAFAVLERCRAIDAERRAASAGAGAGAGGALVEMKRAAVEANCREGLAAGRARTVRYRPGGAHSAGAADGRRVSLEAQLPVGRADRIG